MPFVFSIKELHMQYDLVFIGKSCTSCTRFNFDKKAHAPPFGRIVCINSTVYASKGGGATKLLGVPTTSLGCSPKALDQVGQGYTRSIPAFLMSRLCNYVGEVPCSDNMKDDLTGDF